LDHAPECFPLFGNLADRPDEFLSFQMRTLLAAQQVEKSAAESHWKYELTMYRL